MMTCQLACNGNVTFVRILVCGIQIVDEMFELFRPINQQQEIELSLLGNPAVIAAR
jgi:hypothetical protein